MTNSERVIPCPSLFYITTCSTCFKHSVAFTSVCDSYLCRLASYFCRTDLLDCFLNYIPTYLVACLPTCLLTYLITHLDIADPLIVLGARQRSLCVTCQRR